MRIFGTAIVSLLLLPGQLAFAQSGNLDDTFSSDGKVTTDFGPDSDRGHSVAIQLDGKLVVAGYARAGMGSNFALARYNIDGTLDSEFGTDGKVMTAFGTGYDEGWSVAVQQDGKIVVAGTAWNGLEYGFGLVRYDTEGTLDNSFGTDGKVVTSFGTFYTAIGYSMAIQSDGMIVVVGHSFNVGSGFDFTVVRYNVNGTLDNNFGVSGIVRTDFEMNDDGGASIAIQPDGKIVVAGVTWVNGVGDFALVRYNTDGSLDYSFGDEGRMTTDFEARSDVGRSVIIQSDGKILVSGVSLDDTGNVFATARYNSDGSLDESFELDGKVTTSFGEGSSFGWAVAIQPDGKILVAGHADLEGSVDQFALARYNVDGSLDTSFGTVGKVLTNFEDQGSMGFSIACQLDGKIVVAGTASNVANEGFAVSRYLSDLDIGFVDLFSSESTTLVYPNPLSKQAILRYNLRNSDVISVQLLDTRGINLFTFIEGEKQAAGQHQLTIDIPELLSSGTYLIAISSPNGRITVQVLK